MNFTQASKAFFVNYTNFKGRASRSEFWYACLLMGIFGFIAAILDTIYLIGSQGEISPIGLIINLAILLPSISITTRRLHDIGKSGWWQLIMFTLIGLIPLIYWCSKPGQGDENDFGDNPLSYYTPET